LRMASRIALSLKVGTSQMKKPSWKCCFVFRRSIASQSLSKKEKKPCRNSIRY